MKKASFLERFVAHLIDIFLVSFAAVLLSYPFLDFKSIEKLDDSYTEVVEKALNDETAKNSREITVTDRAVADKDKVTTKTNDRITI